MPEMTETQAADRQRYLADPTYNALINSMVTIIKAPSRIHRIAAIDFFVFGIAMVANPDEVDMPNCDPFSFEILPDGRAKYTREVPKEIIAKYGEPILDPDQFILLQVDEGLKAPQIVQDGADDMRIDGVDPWITAWKRAEAKLDAFLAR